MLLVHFTPSGSGSPASGAAGVQAQVNEDAAVMLEFFDVLSDSSIEAGSIADLLDELVVGYDGLVGPGSEE